MHSQSCSSSKAHIDVRFLASPGGLDSYCNLSCTFLILEQALRGECVEHRSEALTSFQGVAEDLRGQGVLTLDVKEAGSGVSV